MLPKIWIGEGGFYLGSYNINSKFLNNIITLCDRFGIKYYTSYNYENSKNIQDLSTLNYEYMCIWIIVDLRKNEDFRIEYSKLFDRN